MLQILRSVPVGRYLQPIGDWKDGLDMPFIYVRDELYLRVAIGALNVEASVPTMQIQKVEVGLGDQVGVLKQTLQFHKEHSFVENVTFALSPEATSVKMEILIPLFVVPLAQTNQH